ncbi:hypothetical protein TVAG_172870 [Trichomonas vaginalis G3]|uniref:Uncharacterized protein n=1 Tax=Trichomonas vaginalis (strain ATCC PRA-98 / G3) TaxID=412133 RepID=A2DF37_TRIV3|nr:RNA (guanine-N7)-methylation family [Trichomonas vaginalis G3]EAY21029.1 hypothetical protein TVAG_172870 [Trichomonas vaginalis G3]KAI5519204.1 RNA (guanine-N7)-methylation family [Trichomonas vaginalis G3]|eukprot:XP_001582015.1 hypothetical protein [Trichomonas vaginalis G3]
MAKLIACTENHVFATIAPNKLAVLDKNNKISSETELEADLNAIAIDKNRIAVGLRNKEIIIYNYQEDGTITEQFKATAERIAEELAFSDYKGKDCLLLNDGGDIFAYDIADMKNPHLLLGHIATTTSFAISPDHKVLATSDRDGRIRFSKYPNAFDIITFGLQHEEFISDIIYLPSGELISADGDGQLAKWDSNGNFVKLERTFTEQTIIRRICLFNDKIAAINENSSNVYVVDTESLKVVDTIKTNLQPLCIAPFQGGLICGCNGELLKISGNEISVIPGFDFKIDPMPTIAKLRVTTKQIIHKNEKNTEIYNIWRHPELFPSRDHEQ